MFFEGAIGSRKETRFAASDYKKVGRMEEWKGGQFGDFTYYSKTYN